MDLLYSKKSNTFMPLQDGWINHILDKQATYLGEGVKNNMDIRDGLKAAAMTEDE